MGVTPAALVAAACAGALSGTAAALFSEAYVRLAFIGMRPDWRLCVLAARVGWCRPLAARKRAARRNSTRVPQASRTPGVSRASNRQLRASSALLLAVCFGLLCAHGGFSARFCGFAVASFLLLILAGIDGRSHLLPDALTYPLLGLGLAVAWAGVGIAPAAAVGGAMAGFVFLYVCAAVFNRLGGREAVGRGDMKLLAALGAWLGAGALVWVLALACVAGVVAAMLRQRTFRPHGDYPFGPFLAGAALCAFCLEPWLR